MKSTLACASNTPLYACDMFKLSDYLKERQEKVEAALELALPSETTPPERLHEAMRYSALSGGKRLRPILTMAAAECVGADANMVIRPAVAVELLHTYTLIHDDLPCMDDDVERRGKPTSHMVFGEANAILAGDALQALAFELATESPRNPHLVVRELAQAAGSQGVVGGQVADIAAGDIVSEEDLTFIHQHKTADLFRAAIRMGAIAAAASDAQLEKLTRYGAKLGLAFQVIDDILDADDEQDDSCSCIGLYGMDKAKTLAEAMTADAIEAISDYGPGAGPLVAIAEHMLERTY
jgi:geranylgeranyl pyrophosphate synthase